MEKADLLKMVIATYFGKGELFLPPVCLLQLSCPNADMHADKESVTFLGIPDGAVQGDLPRAQAADG